MVAEPYNMRAVLAVVLLADIPAYYLVFNRQVTADVPEASREL